MAKIPGVLTSKRVRGLVWVCDIQDSTAYLNSDEKVDPFEQYIERFYYLTCQIADAAGAVMYKWTGDGFIAWFDCELDRHLDSIAATVLEAAWQLSFLNNVTQFGIEFKKRVKIRHGITYEKDGLKIDITNNDGTVTSDYIGRDVVLAFRIAGIAADFPSIISTNEVVEREKVQELSYLKFEKMDISDEQINKYFKGERRQSNNLYGTSKKIRQNVNGSVETTINTINKVTANIKPKEPSEFSKKYYECFESGPQWVQDLGAKLVGFIKKELVGSFEKINKYIINNNT